MLKFTRIITVILFTILFTNVFTVKPVVADTEIIEPSNNKKTEENSLMNSNTDLITVVKEDRKKNKEVLKTCVVKTESTIQAPNDIPYYNPYDITEVSNISYESLYKMLEGTKFQNMTQFFINCEKQYGINAFYIIAIPALESGWGTSNRSTNGTNNITGYNVISDDSVGTTFNSWEDCIIHTILLLKNHYLNQEGLYAKETSSIYDIGTSYCASSDWADKLNNIIYNMTLKLNS